MVLLLVISAYLIKKAVEFKRVAGKDKSARNETRVSRVQDTLARESDRVAYAAANRATERS